MSLPNIPNINPIIDLDIEKSVNMLLSSIALEEIGLSHIVNAEAEKIQYILGTLESETCKKTSYSLEDILRVNRSIDRTLNGVLKNQILLHTKLEDTIDLYDKYYTSKANDNSELYCNSINTSNDSIVEEIECSPDFFK